MKIALNYIIPADLDAHWLTLSKQRNENVSQKNKSTFDLLADS